VLGPRPAVLAPLLLAFTVLHVQLAHFFTVDTLATTFAAAALLAGEMARRRRSVGWPALAGALAAAGAASKVSAVALLPVLVVGLAWRPRAAESAGAGRRAAHLIGCVAGAAVGFRLLEPYAFVGPMPWDVLLNEGWRADKEYWADVSAGRWLVPYMIQWVGTAPYLTSLEGLVRWGMGPLLGLAAVAGFLLGAWRLLVAALRWGWGWVLSRPAPLSRERGEKMDPSALLLPVLWVGLSFVYFGGQFAKFLRYLLPTYFALVILAVFALQVAWSRARSDGQRRLVQAVGALVVVGTAVWALAFSGIYATTHPRLEASAWLYGRVAADSTLGLEHWDDRLPVALPGQDQCRFRYVELASYDPDVEQKREWLLATLDEADYLVLASQRLVDSIPRLPQAYPIATTYYAELLSGRLGFERVARFEVRPRLGPWVIDDSVAQEDFRVYDHPEVEVWRKRPDYPGPGLAALRAAPSLEPESEAATLVAVVPSRPDPLPASLVARRAAMAPGDIACG
jgi:hypothetical protein